MTTVLGFDVGLKRTGVAVGSRMGKTSRPLMTLAMQNGRVSLADLARLLDEWRPDTVVVGTTETAPGELTKARNHLRHHCQQQQIKVVMIDETLTTQSANAALAETSLSSKAKQSRRDQVAAQIILASYLRQGLS